MDEDPPRIRPYAPLRCWTNSSAAIGICSRQDLGKLPHFDTHRLWIQQAVRLGRVDLRKVDGESNPADLLTKHSLSRERLEKLVKLHSRKHLGGRAKNAPKMREGATGRTTLATETRSLNMIDGDVKDCKGASEDKKTAKCMETVMPHLFFSGDKLESLYPRLVAPEDDYLDGMMADVPD